MSLGEAISLFPSLHSFFADAMTGFEPFETKPELVVALSGGADSMALCLLSHHWARQHGGRGIAVTVDHGLRPGSDREAREVGALLRKRGIEHHVLCWRGIKPVTGVEEAARQARYTLLENWCAERGLLHLMLGHHRDDQAETVALRQEAGSGDVGLAGMAAVVERRHVRILRPLLSLPGRVLRDYLRQERMTWIDDPSNHDMCHHRNRLRAILRHNPDRLSALIASGTSMGQRRRVGEGMRARWFATHVRLHPAGVVDVIDCESIDEECLAAMLRSVGGKPYPPARPALQRLTTRVGQEHPFVGASLGGCVLTGRDGALRIMRERRGLPPAAAVPPGTGRDWDGRFYLTNASADPCVVEPLGTRSVDMAEEFRLPLAVRATLPAFFLDGRLVAVPQLEYYLGEQARKFGSVFRPAVSLSNLGFALRGERRILFQERGARRAHGELKREKTREFQS